MSVVLSQACDFNPFSRIAREVVLFRVEHIVANNISRQILGRTFAQQSVRIQVPKMSSMTT